MKLLEREYFCAMGKRSNRKIFSKVRVLDAGAKGKAVAKAPDGRVLFINNAIPGAVVTVQTTEQRRAYFEATATQFRKYAEDGLEPLCFCITIVFRSSCVATCIAHKRQNEYIRA